MRRNQVWVGVAVVVASLVLPQATTVAGPVGDPVASSGARRPAGAGADALAAARHGGPRPPARPRAGRATPASSCPTTVTRSTRLTRDLVGCAIEIAAPDVTLDLGRRTLTGGSITVRAGADRARIAGGTLDGSSVAGAFGGRDVEIDHVVVRGVPSFAVETWHGWTISDATFEDNLVAVDVFTGARGVTVRRSIFDGNTIGVNVGKGEATTVAGNRFVGDAIGVNVWDEDAFSSNDTVVEGNRFDGNATGVSIVLLCSPDTSRRPCDDAVRGTRIIRNRFVGNTSSGLTLHAACTQGAVAEPVVAPSCAGDDTRIVGNAFVDNGADGTPPLRFPIVADDGITVTGTGAGAGRITLRANLAIGNHDLGIEAPGVVDGGGNRAAANGTGDCLGVACAAPVRRWWWPGRLDGPDEPAGTDVPTGPDVPTGTEGPTGSDGPGG